MGTLAMVFDPYINRFETEEEQQEYHTTMAKFTEKPVPNLPAHILLLAIDREGDANIKKIWPKSKGKTEIRRLCTITCSKGQGLTKPITRAT